MKELDNLQYQFGKLCYLKGYQGYIREVNNKYIVTLYKTNGVNVSDTTTNVIPIYQSIIPKFKSPKEIFQHINIESPELFL